MTTLEEFRSVLMESSRIVSYTGAGLNTESGIPDYCSQGGICEKFQRVPLRRKQTSSLMATKEIPVAGDPGLRAGQDPYFFKQLSDNGRLLVRIAQNIDVLHEKSGLPADDHVNLNGTNLEIIYLKCRDITPAHEILENLELENEAPLCIKCGGLLKPKTISFGRTLKPQDLDGPKSFNFRET